MVVTVPSFLFGGAPGVGFPARLPAVLS